MSADGFREALAAIGIDARVDGQGRVAVVTTGTRLSFDAGSRRRIVALGREQGFSNIALELAPDENLSGD
jgi:hypothetical protein